MSSFKYFFDAIDGTVTELSGLTSIGIKEFRAEFPGVNALRMDGYSVKMARAESGALLPVTRAIEYKSRPSLHDCNAKCLNGKSTGTCECRCGGKNHGRGMFTRLVAA